MSTYILTSMFPNGFDDRTTEVFQSLIIRRQKFAFVASEFEVMHEKTDAYFRMFLNMLQESGISFDQAYVVDGRMTENEAQKAVREADVVWLSGGNTPIEFAYLKKYGLCDVIKSHEGVIIGMSAGSINMAETAICTLSCGHAKQEEYKGLGCVDISVEPHFVRDVISEELLELSYQHTIYGLCDGSVIVCEDGNIAFYGEVYRINGGKADCVDGKD